MLKVLALLQDTAVFLFLGMFFLTSVSCADSFMSSYDKPSVERQASQVPFENTNSKGESDEASDAEEGGEEGLASGDKLKSAFKKDFKFYAFSLAYYKSPFLEQELPPPII